MAQDETTAAKRTGTALMVVRAPAERVAPRPRTVPRPEFLSQMLAARDRLPIQRQRRRAPLSAALDAYAEGSDRGIPRLPAGSYRSRTI